MRPSRKKTGGPKKPKKKMNKNLRIALISIASVFGALCLALFIYVVVAVAGTPAWHPDDLSNQKESSIVLDKDGNKIGQLHADENRLIATSEEIPQLIKDTFVAIEDKRFYSHIGVDPIRIIGAALIDIKERSARQGASTITQQLARNAFIENPTAKKLSRKLQEAALAIQLEREYTKDEILTFYLNRISLGQRSFGIKAAAQTYFGKELNELDPAEIALLAGLPQATTSYNPYINPDRAKDRRNIVLKVMLDADLITEDEYNQYKEEGFPYIEAQQQNDTAVEKVATYTVDYKYPYFVDHVIDELVRDYGFSEEEIFNGGLVIKTTVDSKIQEQAEKSFANAANFPQSVDSTPVQGAITVLNHETGGIVAMVGGREYTPRGLNRAATSSRQPGSTIKPLVVYAPALEKGGYFPGSVFDDMPVEYPGGNGKVWAPVDFDTETSGWKGLITMREALRNSVNVYAVRLMNDIGVNYGWTFAKEKLGLPLKDGDKVLSLALGTTHVSTLDMASAYGTFPNKGVRVTPHAVTEVSDSNGKVLATAKVTSERVMKETTAFLMNDMLRTVVTSGTGVSAQIGNWAVCGKTGTTSLDPDKYGQKSGNPDAWFAGYTPKYTAVVWMGYDKDEDLQHYLRKVYGGSYPAKIWKEVMTVALQGLEVQTQYTQPAGIVSGSYDMKSGLLPSSLTPQQFVGTEIAAQGDFPTKVSDIWSELEVDGNNPTYLAGPTTLNKLKKVFLNISGRKESASWPTDEAPYKAPTETSPAVQNPSPPTESAISPPPGDDTLPVLALANVIYDAPKEQVTLEFSYPAGSEKYGLVIYIKRPGQNSLETYHANSLQSLHGSITIPLGKGKNNPGDYYFWIAATDGDGAVVGNPSKNNKLSIKD